MTYIFVQAAPDEKGIDADFSDIEEFIEGEKILDIVYLLTSRSLSHLAMLQEKYYKVTHFNSVGVVLGF